MDGPGTGNPGTGNNDACAPSQLRLCGHFLARASLHVDSYSHLRTIRHERAALALRTPRKAYTTPVQYEAHRKRRPIGRRQYPLKVALDLFGIGVARQAEPQRQPPYMRIDHETGLAEDMPKQDIGGLTPDARKRHQLFHRSRHLTGETFEDLARRTLQRFRLVPEEAGRDDKPFDSFRWRRRLRCNIGNFSKERRRTAVDTLVGALRRENRRDQALPRRLEVEADARFGIETRKRTGKPRAALAKAVHSHRPRSFRLSCRLLHSFALSRSQLPDYNGTMKDARRLNVARSQRRAVSAKRLAVHPLLRRRARRVSTRDAGNAKNASS